MHQVKGVSSKPPTTSTSSASSPNDRTSHTLYIAYLHLLSTSLEKSVGLNPSKARLLDGDDIVFTMNI